MLENRDCVSRAGSDAPHLIAFQRKNGTTSTSAPAKSLLSGQFHIFHGLSMHWGSECMGRLWLQPSLTTREHPPMQWSIMGWVTSTIHGAHRTCAPDHSLIKYGGGCDIKAHCKMVLPRHFLKTPGRCQRLHIPPRFISPNLAQPPK